MKLTLLVELVLSFSTVSFAKEIQRKIAIENAEKITARTELEKSIVKISYVRKGRDRKEAVFYSTAFFIADNVLMTSGHSIEGDISSLKVMLPTLKKWIPVPIFGKVISNNEYSTIARRGRYWLKYEGWDQRESFDVGALIIDSSGIPFESIGIAEISEDIPSVADKIALIGFDKNEVGEKAQFILSKAIFGIDSLNEMTLSYRMDTPDLPYTEIGDSGSPLVQNGKVIGIHSSNYAKFDEVTKFYYMAQGYSSLMSFSKAKFFFRKLRKKGGRIPEGLDSSSCPALFYSVFNEYAFLPQY